MERINRTLLNWRWWAALPVVIPLGLTSAALWANVILWRLPYKAAWESAKLVDGLLDKVARPVMKWARPEA